MRKKLLMVFGLASSLALAVAFATDAARKAPAAAIEKDAQKAAIAVEGKQAHPCHKAEGSCLRKSSAAKAKASGDQNMASSGILCPKSADCPKADCDGAHCLKKSGAEAKAESPEKTGEPSKAGTEI